MPGSPERASGALDHEGRHCIRRSRATWTSSRAPQGARCPWTQSRSQAESRSSSRGLAGTWPPAPARDRRWLRELRPRPWYGRARPDRVDGHAPPEARAPGERGRSMGSLSAVAARGAHEVDVARGDPGVHERREHGALYPRPCGSGAATCAHRWRCRSPERAEPSGTGPPARAKQESPAPSPSRSRCGAGRRPHALARERAEPVEAAHHERQRISSRRNDGVGLARRSISGPDPSAVAPRGARRRDRHRGPRAPSQRAAGARARRRARSAGVSPIRCAGPARLLPPSERRAHDDREPLGLDVQRPLAGLGAQIVGGRHEQARRAAIGDAPPVHRAGELLDLAPRPTRRSSRGSARWPRFPRCRSRARPRRCRCPGDGRDHTGRHDGNALGHVKGRENSTCGRRGWCPVRVVDAGGEEGALGPVEGHPARLLWLVGVVHDELEEAALIDPVVIGDDRVVQLQPWAGW